MKKEKVNRRVRLTKQMIHESLIELLEKKPVNKVSVSELCKLADINRTTFYNHYGEPRDVLNEIGEQIAENISESVHLNPKTGASSLEDQVTSICIYLKKHPKEALLLLNHFTADDKVIRNLFLNRISSGQVDYLPSVQYGQNGQKLLFQFLTHGIYNLIKCWILEDIDLEPQEIGKMALDIASNGWLKDSTRF